MIHSLQGTSWHPRPCASGLAGHHDRAAAPAPATRFAGESIERDVTGSLTIVTKEGDKVTLSAESVASLSRAAVSTPEGRGVSASVSLSRSLSISVEGDLNASERHDIARIVRTFLHDLRAAAKGRDVSVANVAGGHPSTLASVSAELESSTTVTLLAGAVNPTSGEPDAGSTGAPSGSLAGFAQPQPVAAPIVAADSRATDLGPAVLQAGLGTAA